MGFHSMCTAMMAVPRARNRVRFVVRSDQTIRVQNPEEHALLCLIFTL